MKAFEPVPFKSIAKAIIVTALVFAMAFIAGTILHTVEVNGGSSDHGTAESPLTSMVTTTIDVDSTAYYLAVGSTVRVDSTDTYVIDDYTDGYGLTFKDGAVYGTISKAGTIVIKIVNIADGDDFYHFTIYAVESNSTMVKAVFVSSASSSVNVGRTITLYATTSPEDAADRTVTWSIASGSSFATIQSQSDTATGGTCILKGVAAGTVTVQAEADDGSDAIGTISITVKQEYTYTLNYNLNGGSIGPSYTNKFATDTTSTLAFTVSSTKPVRDGYTFLGWSTSPTAASASYQPGDTISVTYNGATLYAVWQANYKTYSLLFNANQGYNSPDQLTGTSNTGSCTFTIPASQPSRVGYTFLGWSESSSASSASYLVGSTYTATTTSVTLYAVWKQIEYTCTLDYSAIGATNVPSKQTYTSTSTSIHTFTISSTKPAKGIATFLGWSKTNGSPTAEYRPGGTIIVDFNENVTLYAVWGETVYTSTLKYSAEGATNVPEDQVYKGTSEDVRYFTISLLKPEKEGYRFVGWSKTEGGTSADFAIAGTVSVAYNGTRTLYAVWEPIEYTCHLYYNATGAYDVPVSDSYTGTATSSHMFTISTTIPHKTGSTFLGWSTTETATVADYQPGGTIFVPYDGYVTLHAVWIQNISITSFPSVSCLIDDGYAYNVQTNVSGCTLAVTGATWLKASGNTVSGTPTSAGTYTITITASRDGYISASQTFDLEAMTGYDSAPSAAGIYAYAW